MLQEEKELLGFEETFSQQLPQLSVCMCVRVCRFIQVCNRVCELASPFFPTNCDCEGVNNIFCPHFFFLFFFFWVLLCYTVLIHQEVAAAEIRRGEI